MVIDQDIIVLANPEIAKLPAWVIALLVVGGLAAAGIAGMHPPGFVAQVVALAFGLASSSFH